MLENIDLREQFNFNEEESLVIECLTLYQKIVCAMCSVACIGMEEGVGGKEERVFVVKNVQMITQILVRKLLSDQSLPLIEDSTA